MGQQQTAGTTGGQRPARPPASPAVTAVLAPTAAEIGVAAGTVLSQAAVLEITEQTLEALSHFARARVGSRADQVRHTLEAGFPERTQEELDPIVVEEMRRERVFQRRMAARIRRDLPKALREADPDARRVAVQKLLKREKRYVGQRIDAMHARSIARAEHLAVQEASPLGAYWWLSPFVHRHTPDCVALGHQFWPWKFLEEVHPPMHPGCPCELLTLKEAVDRGYMVPEQIPDPDRATEDGKKKLRDALALEQALSPEQWHAYLDELAEAANLTEARWERRYPVGTKEGGRFKPHVGGVAHALARTLLPSLPETPLQKLRLGRGEARRIEGRRVVVPEARHFERRFGERTFVSPLGTTEVERVGGTGAADGPSGPLHVGRRSNAAAELLHPHRERARQQAADRARGTDPVLDGADGGATDAGLRRAGWAAFSAVPADGGHEFSYRRDDGALLIVNTGADGRVLNHRQLEPPARPAGRELTRPPRSWAEYEADLTGYADRVAADHGRRSTLAGVTEDPSLADHAASTDWQGTMALGQGFRPAVERAAAVRAAGGTLSDDDARDYYGAVQSATHEALHAASPVSDTEDFADPAVRNLEEALAEELSHVEAAARLRAQGDQDALDWRADHPLDPKAAGSYLPEREALSRILDAGEVAPQDREALIRRLLLDQTPADRVAELERLDPGARALLAEPPDADALHPQPILAPPLEPTHRPTGLEIRRKPVQLGDSVIVDAGRVGTVAAVRTTAGRPLATVEFPGGSVEYAVSADRLGAHTPADPRAAGSWAPEASWEGGLDPAEGDRLRWAHGGAGTLSRVLSPDLLDVRLDDGRRVYLRRRQARSLHLRAEGPPEAGLPMKGGGHPATLEAHAAALARFDAHGQPLVPTRLLVPTERPPHRPAAPRGAAPLEVAARPDGRLNVATGSEHVYWARANGVSHLPVRRNQHIPGWPWGPKKDEPKVPTGQSPVHGSGPSPESEVSGAGEPVNPQRLWGGEVLQDADGKRWKVSRVLVKGKGINQVVTGADLVPHAPDYSGPTRKKTKPAELAAMTFVGGGPKKSKGWAAEPKVSDDGTVTLGKSAGGTQGARWGETADGQRYVVKTYRGDRDRVATELLGNALYRKLGVEVPEAGLLEFGGRPAVASRAIEGKTERWTEPSLELGAGFMADALLANWDVVGLEQDNVLWHEGRPFRVDQGGTLEYRAQGQKKAFGPVPSEVWSMARPGGQGFGTMLLSPEGKRDQARQIAEKLTPQAVDELVDAAPFADAAMRERVRENLKARVEWMGRYADGLEGEPQLPTGDAASKLLGQRPPKLYPEQASALEGFLAGWQGPVNDHLRSGEAKDKARGEVRFVVRELDSLLGASRAPESFDAWVALPSKPAVGARLLEHGYLVATASREAALEAAGPTGSALRLTVPKGSKVIHVPSVAGQLEGPVAAEPSLILDRGLRALVVAPGEAVLVR